MANLKIKLVRGFQGRKDDQIATALSWTEKDRQRGYPAG